MTTQHMDNTQGVKVRDTFYSQTMWLLDDWILEVRYGNFLSSDDADDFSAADLALGYSECLWLHHPQGTSPLSYDDVRIFRRVDHADIQSSPLTIADLQEFANVQDMVCIAQTFGKHAHAKSDNILEIDLAEHGLQYPLDLGLEIPANDDADAASHDAHRA